MAGDALNVAGFPLNRFCRELPRLLQAAGGPETGRDAPEAAGGARERLLEAGSLVGLRLLRSGLTVTSLPSPRTRLSGHYWSETPIVISLGAR